MAARGAGIQLERVAGAFKLHLVGDDLHTGLARHRQLLTYIYILYIDSYIIFASYRIAFDSTLHLLKAYG